jgi:hypothetical protein
MSLPWSPTQVEWLRAMGLDVLALRGAGQGAGPTAPGGPAVDAGAAGALPPGLARAARGIDLAPLLDQGVPGDIGGRRALWRALRPLRKAARSP